MIIKIWLLNWKLINKNVIFILRSSKYKNVIFIYIVTTGNEDDEDAMKMKISIKRRVVVLDSFRWELLTLNSFFSSYIYIYIYIYIYMLGCRRCLVAPDTNRPQTMDLFVWLFGDWLWYWFECGLWCEKSNR